MSDNILVIGGGGREHALVWKLSQSKDVQKIFVTPGNAGTQKENKVQNISLNFDDAECLVCFCKTEHIDLVIVGPEAPLSAGISDILNDNNIPCFGPRKLAAQIESSKLFSKTFMNKYNIPTAKWKYFNNLKDSCTFIDDCSFNGIVVKASGLAKGKGVFVTSSKEEAKNAVHIIMEDKMFGDAGETVIIEEKLDGEEVSVFAFSDGTTISCFPPAQDFKCAYDGECGPNTGGMGAFAPVSYVSSDILQYIKTNIISKTIEGLRLDGMLFVGLLYTGLMLTDEGPKVLEYNCRFGDPETQVLLSLKKSDLYKTLKDCTQGNLNASHVCFEKDKFAVSVIIASGGYPGSVEKGLKINFTAEEKDPIHRSKLFHSGTTYIGKDIFTNGGRVLCATGFGKSLKEARNCAYKLASDVNFDKMFYRKDIAEDACKRLDQHRGVTYADSGVDISAGDSFVEFLKPLAKKTYRTGCITDLGSFGGLFDLRKTGYKDPILVSGTDGVGTKLKIAKACMNHQTIGIDLVAMCVNDIIVHGAEPLFFMDYFACGKLDVSTTKEVLSGIAKGCTMAGCSLIGGETAEMPGMYHSSDYDIAGFAVGIVERDKLLPRESSISHADVVIGLHSSGVHSNGFSLIRKIVENLSLSYDEVCPFKIDGKQTKTLGEVLLTQTKIYVNALLPLMREGKVQAFSHITGGGLLNNLPRVLPSNLVCILDSNSWPVPSVFDWIAKNGNVSSQEMIRTFNCGIGGVLIVSENDRDYVLRKLQESKEMASVIGVLKKRRETEPQVVVNGLAERWAVRNFISKKKKMIGVLISGSGTNLQALIDHCRQSCSSAQIVLVISNKPDVEGLRKASKAGIPTKVINHKDFTGRVDFDMKLLSTLKKSRVELVCLAGFMRILSPEFVNSWHGRLLNIHPSLLPSFKGVDTHQQALEAGVRVTGCTVHFVVPAVDAGGIIAQESVPVMNGDTIKSLQERVKQKEWQLYPRALEMVVNGKVQLMDDGKVSFL